MGMSSSTGDSTAEFTIRFKEELSPINTNLRIFCKQSSCSYDLLIENEDTSYIVDVDTSMEGLSFINIEIDTPRREFRVRMLKNELGQHQFEFHGMCLESSENSGVIYHSVGVGASQYKGLLYSELFEDHLRVLEPDLVILDFGTNDYLYDDKIKPELENQIVEIIEKVRNAAPNTAILLPTVQDLYYHNRNITSGDAFTKLIRKIAKEHQCLFYDWFWIAGGRATITEWRDRNFALNDLVHLNLHGYRLKGQMLGDALVNTMDWMAANNDAQSYILSTDELERDQEERLKKLREKNELLLSTDKYKMYKIQPGDTLGHIAIKHDVSVKQLQQWNNLQSTRIIAGKTLVIYE